MIFSIKPYLQHKAHTFLCSQVIFLLLNYFNDLALIADLVRP